MHYVFGNVSEYRVSSLRHTARGATTVNERSLEMFVLSYARNPLATNRMNVGIVGFEKNIGKTTFADARFVKGMIEILAFDRNADIGLLARVFEDIARRCENPSDAELFVQIMMEDFSNMLQISDKKVSIFEGEPGIEMDRLEREYLHSHCVEE